MSLSSAIQGLFEKPETKVGELLPANALFGNTLITLVAFVALLVVGRSFLTEQVVTMLGWLVGGYLFKETVTKLMTVYWNGKIRHRELELAYVDGKLDDNEAQLLGNAADTLRSAPTVSARVYAGDSASRQPVAVDATVSARG